MQQQDERTRFVHWILLLLFASFAGFNHADFGIRWIQLVVDRFAFFPHKFECDAGAVAAVSHQPLRQNDACPM